MYASWQGLGLGLGIGLELGVGSGLRLGIGLGVGLVLGLGHQLLPLTLALTSSMGRARGASLIPRARSEIVPGTERCAASEARAGASAWYLVRGRV